MRCMRSPGLWEPVGSTCAHLGTAGHGAQGSPPHLPPPGLGAPGWHETPLDVSAALYGPLVLLWPMSFPRQRCQRCGEPCEVDVSVPVVFDGDKLGGWQCADCASPAAG